MATDNDLKPVRQLLGDALEDLEAANPDWEEDHNYYDSMKAISDWLDHPDNRPIPLNKSESVAMPSTVMQDFEKINELMDKFKGYVWPKDMVMLHDLQDAVEAWERFKIAYFG